MDKLFNELYFLKNHKLFFLDSYGLNLNLVNEKTPHLWLVSK